MRLNEADVQLPYIRDVLGHVDLSITLSLHARGVMRSGRTPGAALTRPDRPTLRITQHCS